MTRRSYARRRYTGSPAGPVDWSVLERIFDALFGPDLHGLDQDSNYRVHAHWDDVNEIRHDATTLRDVEEAYKGKRTSELTFSGRQGADGMDCYFAYSLTEDPPSAYAHLEGDPGTVESMLAVIREAFPLQPNIVFISWSGDPGQAVAAALADVIGARLPSGGDVFVTPRLPAGAAPIAEIESNLRRTTAHVAVMTPEAVESDWVLWELASSWAREVPVFPICVGIAPGELPDPVRLFLQAVRIEDTAGMERTFAELVTATGAVAGALSASDLEAIRRGKQ